VILYDDRSRGAESYINLAKEIIAKHMPGFQAFAEPAQTDSSAQLAEGEEKQVVNAPRWRRWRERNKLITMDLKS